MEESQAGAAQVDMSPSHIDWFKNRKWSQYTNNYDVIRQSLAISSINWRAHTIVENGEENLQDLDEVSEC